MTGKTNNIRLLALLLAVAAMLTATGCAKAGPSDTGTTEGTVSLQASVSTTEEAIFATEETLAPIYTRPGDEDEEPVDPDVDYMDEEVGDDAPTAVTPGASGQAGVGAVLTWENINSFPIKDSGMSTAQLRQLCVDFFRYSKTAVWKPSISISYIRNASGSSDSMIGGQRYGGLPYVGNASGNIYRLMDYIDESTGVADLSDFLGGTNFTSTEQLRYFGNQCANGAHVGWGRVINSVKQHHTAAMTSANGYIPLGSYTYNQSSWTASNRTTAVCEKNGEQVMFASYALLQPADGLVYYTTAGHVIMASTEASVVRNADGTIDGDRSYVLVVHQAQSWLNAEDNGGGAYKFKSGVDERMSFRKLFDESYVPFTFGEFTGAEKVEATSCSFSHSGDTITLSQLFSAKVTSNYSITDAYAVFTDSAGKEIYRHAVRNKDSFGKTLTMAKSGARVDSWGTLPSGACSVTVEAQLATGERPVIYKGTVSS